MVKTLCIFPGLHWPIFVEVSYRDECSPHDTEEAHICHLEPTDAQKLLKLRPDYRRIDEDSLRLRCSLPSKCLIFPEKFNLQAKSTKVVNGIMYEIPCSTSRNRDLYIIAMNKHRKLCMTLGFLYGVQKDYPEWALVSLQEPVVPEDASGVHVDGWGTLHLVKTRHIYSADSIRDTRNEIIQKKLHGKLRIPIDKKSFEWVTFSWNMDMNVESSTSVDVENHPTDKVIMPDVRPHQHLSQEKLPESDIRKVNKSFETSGDERKRDGNSGLPLTGVEIADTEACVSNFAGNTKGFKETIQWPDEESPLVPDVEVRKKKNNFKRREWKPITLYASCFTPAIVGEERGFEGITPGDNIIAIAKHHADVLGIVRNKHRLPEVDMTGIYVAIKFEHPLNKDAFDIRHIYGESCWSPAEDSNLLYVSENDLIEPSSFNDYGLRLVPKEVLKLNRMEDITVNYELGNNGNSSLKMQLQAIPTYRGSPLTGIEGCDNSCYVDASIFAVFAFNPSFDQELMRDVSNRDKMIVMARNILVSDIINPLRSGEIVKNKSVCKLRKVFADILNDKAYLGEFYDSEIFLSHLFADILQTNGLFQLVGGTRETILQLFPVSKCEYKVPSLSYLLTEYFSETSIALQEVPDSGLIVKLPVCDGTPSYKQVYVDTELKLVPSNVTVKLSSIICLRSNHFTCFIRVPYLALDNTAKVEWFYHDSMATDRGKLVAQCPNLEEFMNSLPGLSNRKCFNSFGNETLKHAKHIMKNAYICIYTK